MVKGTVGETESTSLAMAAEESAYRGGPMAAKNVAAGAVTAGSALVVHKDARSTVWLSCKSFFGLFKEVETLTSAACTFRGSVTRVADLSFAFTRREGSTKPIHVDLQGLMADQEAPSEIVRRLGIGS